MANPTPSTPKSERRILKKLWLSLSWNNDPTTLTWMVRVDMNKWFKFVELSGGRIGLTQANEHD